MYIYLDESSHLDSEKIIDETERHIDSIIARESRSFPLFLRRIPKPQLTVFRQKIREIVEVYPQKMRPFIMAWLIAAYFSIIPGAGTLSLLFWGGIAKWIQRGK